MSGFNAHRQPQVRGFLVNAWGWRADALWSMYQGASCFLCCGGPSLERLPLELLHQRGVLTAAVNQCGATHVRPNLWFCVDTPASFHEAIWADPFVKKFVFRCRSRECPRHWDGKKWRSTRRMSRHYPNVWFYEHGYGFDPQTFLTVGRPTWGGDWDTGGGVMRQTRSVMLVALRILYWLGVRTVYLAGVDFAMTPEESYAFDEPKDGRACGTNNNTYGILNQWFKQLRSHFEAAGLRVVNVTPGSRLDAFDRLDFGEAIRTATSRVPPATTVKGLYTT